MFENEVIEFKEKLNDRLEREVVAFLNTTHGGSIYIGIADDGTAVGVDGLDSKQKEIKDRLKNNISPSTVGLFEIATPVIDGKQCIQVIVSGGNQQPYYIKKFGMSTEGCFFRVGSTTEKMTDGMIMELFQKRSKETLTSRRSPRQDLSFNYLRQHYVEKGYEVGDNFLIQLELYTEEDEFNYLAYLLSDQNCLKYQYARYDRDDVFNLVEHKEFGNQSILKTTSDILEFIQNRNSTFSQITATGRTDRNKFNAIAMRELIVNAIVHNNYLSNGLPAFEEFSNRFEISSFGGLPEGFSQEDFLNGYSLPVNPELIRVFRDLGLAERLGTGIRRVLKFYPKEIFRFSSNFLRVNLPFERPIPSYERMREEPKTSLMNLLKEEPGITRAYAAERLGISESSVYRELKRLEETGKIRREGSKKNGRWVVD